MTERLGWLARREWYSLLFARGLGPIDLLSRMGGRADEIVRRTAAEAEAETHYPDRLVVRAGRRKPWTFAIEPFGGLGGNEMVCRVSAGTIAVALSRDAKGHGFFSYAEDGRLVTGFQSSMAWIRHGADPDRFLPAMRRLGLDLGERRDPGGGRLDPDVAAARLAAGELGVHLDERAFNDAALASVTVPLPLPVPSTSPQATGPVFDLDDPQDTERFERHRREGAVASGTTVRFSIARRAERLQRAEGRDWHVTE